MGIVHEHTQLQAALLTAGQNGYRLENILTLKIIGRKPVPGRLG